MAIHKRLFMVQESMKHFPIPLPACRQAGETGRRTPTNSGELKVLAAGQFLVLFNFCVLGLFCAAICNAQEAKTVNIKNPKGKAAPAKVSAVSPGGEYLNKRIKDLEAIILRQDKARLELEDKVSMLEKKGEILLNVGEEKAKAVYNLTKQVSQLKRKEEEAVKLTKEREEVVSLLKSREKQLEEYRERIWNLEKEKSSIENKIKSESKKTIENLQKDKESLALLTEAKNKEEGTLRREKAVLEGKVAALEKETVVINSMLQMQMKDLRRPYLASGSEDSADKIIHLNLGYAYGLKNEIARAIGEYRQALRYAPDDKDIHYNLGYLLTREGKYKGAIEEYKQALKGTAQDREVYYNLAIIYAAYLRDKRLAQENYKAFLNLSSDAKPGESLP